MNDTNNNDVGEDWIIVENGMFTCGECENEGTPLTNTVDGMVEADLTQIQADLEEFPTKIIYGVCPICGMEYVFKLHEGQLYLEPSEEEK